MEHGEDSTLPVRSGGTIVNNIFVSVNQTNSLLFNIKAVIYNYIPTVNDQVKALLSVLHNLYVIQILLDKPNPYIYLVFDEFQKPSENYKGSVAQL